MYFSHDNAVCINKMAHFIQIYHHTQIQKEKKKNYGKIVFASESHLT